MAGSVYLKSGNAISLNGFHAYAQQVVLPKLYSSLFQRSPILTFMTGKMKGESMLGRPGTLGIIGGSGNFSVAQRENYAGTEIHQRLQTGKVGGGKWMAIRDSNPSTGNDSQDQKVRTAIWRWAQYKQPMKVWQSTLDAAKGDKYKIADAIEEATQMATEELYDTLAYSIYRGAPSDQTADRWDSPLGIMAACHASNVYANLDRSSATYWAGKRVTTAFNIGLNIIDDANLVQGCSYKGPGVDFVICGSSLYNKLKQEALARGQRIEVTAMPGSPEVGVKQECIKYGNTYITYDPFLTGNWSAYDSDITDATKVVICLTSEDFVCDFHPDYNFAVQPFKYQGEIQGGDDAVTSNLSVQLRPRVTKPWRSVMYSNVS